MSRLNLLAQALLVKCTGDSYPGTNEPRCTVGDLISLGYNIIHLLFYLGTVAATAVIVYGAFVIITSAGDKARLKKGNDAITNAVIGIVLIASAWIVVNTLFWLFGVSCPWYKLTGCQF